MSSLDRCDQLIAGRQMTLAQQSNKKDMITRIRGRYIGRNASSAYKDLVWAVGTAKDTTVGIEEQTIQTLAALDKLLQEQGSHRSQIVSAQVYLTDMANKLSLIHI